jgi:two-component system, chemotaxis family, chemotaxis protein CheY
MTTTVLVVDDSLMVRRHIGKPLKELGYDVVEAVDGVDALEKLKSRPARLIVCDVNMPRMNGMELLEQLQAQKAGIPVVMLTTEDQPELMQRAKSLGAKAWLVKPFKADTLTVAAQKLAPIGT